MMDRWTNLYFLLVLFNKKRIKKQEYYLSGVETLLEAVTVLKNSR